MKTGFFFVLEGSDGSGKGTQFKLLAERLRAVGYDVDVYDFPQYDESSSYFVQQYLNGEYGPASEISPFTASLFFALDRFEAAPKIRQSIADGKIVLANRYAGSNMAHQGSKFTNSGEQRGFFVWADSLEFQLLGIPRPNLNIFLKVPAEISYKLIKQKQARSYTDKTHDEHEGDIDHLRKSVSTYETICKLFPKDYKLIDCSKNGKILPITDINNFIWETLQPLLPKPNHGGRSVTVNLSEKALPRASSAPKELKKASNNDMGLILNDLSLLAVKNLAASGSGKIKYKLAWPPKNDKSRINFYIPMDMPVKLANDYQKTMNRLTSLHQQMSKLIDEFTKKNPASPIVASARASLTNVIPMAALSDVTVTIDQELETRFLDYTYSNTLGELNKLARSLAKKLNVNRASSNDEAERTTALNKVLKQIEGSSDLGKVAEYNNSPVSLIEAWPRNELELIADVLYEQSGQSRAEIITTLDKLTYEQKADVLKAALTQKPRAILEKTRYHFDVITSIPTMEEVILRLNPREIQMQPCSPRYGYDVPQSLEELGLDDKYISCFDLSLKLYSQLQSLSDHTASEYAVLFGHKLRWQFTTNAEAILGSYPSSSAPFKELLSSMRSVLAETHPLVGSTKQETSVREKGLGRRKDRPIKNENKHKSQPFRRK